MATNKKVENEYSMEEVSKVLKVELSEIDEFVQEGLIDLKDTKNKTLDEYNFNRLKAGMSLKKDLGVNLPGIDIILNLQEKLSHVQGEFNDFLGSVRKKLENSLDADLEEIQRLRKKK